MFSITTIASSTTNPLAIASASATGCPGEYPNKYITAQVPIRETGTATAGMDVARPFRKKRNTTRMTSNTEISRVRSMSETEARMVSVRSRIVIRCSPRGMVACSAGIAACTASTVVMILAPGWRKMSISTDGLPLRKPACRTVCWESTISATSCKRTTLPFEYFDHET